MRVQGPARQTSAALDSGQYNGRNVVIDTTPDFRQQVLRVGSRRLDAIVYTHAHADHILGLDDVRPFNFRQRGSIPVYGSGDTLAALHRVFGYVFTKRPNPGPDTGPAKEGRSAIRTFRRPICAHPRDAEQGTVYGFKFGTAAYLTDHSGIPAESKARLRGLDVLFLDALRHRPTPPTPPWRAPGTSRGTAAERAFFTHMCHDLAHEETERGASAECAPRLRRPGNHGQGASHETFPHSLGEAAGRFGPSVLTVGNFDGVHAGHRRIMRRVAEEVARRARLEAVRASPSTRIRRR